MSQSPALVLLVYPITLVIGSIFSVISPVARPSRTTTTTTDDQGPTPPVNYFARKDNVFNVYFVKIGWAWTTLAFAVLLLTQPYFVSRSTPAQFRARRALKAVLRYALVTAAWFVTTQRFFGPPIIDRAFVLTGGKCERVLKSGPATTMVPGGDGLAKEKDNTWDEFKNIMTGAACKAAGGAWKGGHDVSGHVFMLVLASAFLAFEALGAAKSVPVRDGTTTSDGGDERPKGTTTRNELDDSSSASAAASAIVERADVPLAGRPLRVWAQRYVWVVVALSWWMLFMKLQLSGLLLSISVVYCTYILPRRCGSWRSIIGIPGE